MKTRYLIQESVQALHANVLRSSLTIIGIVVGIFSVTAMLALGAGLSQNVLERISSFSQGDLSVQGNLTQADLTWILEQPYTKAAIGTLSMGTKDAVVLGQQYSVSLTSVLGDLGSVQTITMRSGSMFATADPNLVDRVAVVSGTLDTKLKEKTGVSALGQVIAVSGQRFDIVGVTEDSSAGFVRNDGTLYLPYRTAVGALASSNNFNLIGVKLKDPNDFAVAGKAVLAGLNASRYLALDTTDVFTVSTAQSLIESAQQTTAMISLFLGIVGGIALFVGGIGTMNMMLTTVSERTKEIGLRKAIGAHRRDILLQVLFESIMLTVVGGSVGILLTFVGSYFANAALAGSNMLRVVVSGQVVLLATCVAIVVGVVFGLYPASRASKLQPVDALRAE